MTGRPIIAPIGDRNEIKLLVSGDVHRALRTMATAYGTSVAQYVRTALYRHVADVHAKAGVRDE